MQPNNPSANDVFNHIANQGPTLTHSQEFQTSISRHRLDALANVIYASQARVDISNEKFLVPVITERQIQNWRTNNTDPAYFIDIPPSSDEHQHPWANLDPQAAENVFADQHPVLHTHLSRLPHLFDNPNKDYWWERDHDIPPMRHDQDSIAVTPSAAGYRAAPLAPSYGVVGNIATIKPYAGWMLNLLNSQLFQFVRLMFANQQHSLESLHHFPIVIPQGQVKYDLENCARRYTNPEKVLHDNLQRTDTEYAVFELYQLNVPQRRTLIDTLMHHRDQLGLPTPDHWYALSHIEASAGAWRYDQEKHPA